MSTIHYIDIDGNYLGGFGDGAEPPEGAIETDPPTDGRMKKLNGVWTDSQEILDERARIQQIKNAWQKVVHTDSVISKKAIQDLLKILLKDMLEGDE